MAMIVFLLEKKMFNEVRSGEKTVEYRKVKPYWNKRFYDEIRKSLTKIFGKERAEKVLPDIHTFMKMYETDNVLFGDGTEEFYITWECKIRMGYTSNYINAKITKIEIVNGNETSLHINRPVYAIHLKDVKEVL